jgi:hypothetical protein
MHCGERVERDVPQVIAEHVSSHSDILQWCGWAEDMSRAASSEHWLPCRHSIEQLPVTLRKSSLYTEVVITARL